MHFGKVGRWWPCSEDCAEILCKNKRALDMRLLTFVFFLLFFFKLGHPNFGAQIEDTCQNFVHATINTSFNNLI